MSLPFLHRVPRGVRACTGITLPHIALPSNCQVSPTNRSNPQKNNRNLYPLSLLTNTALWSNDSYRLRYTGRWWSVDSREYFLTFKGKSMTAIGEFQRRTDCITASPTEVLQYFLLNTALPFQPCSLLVFIRSF